MTNDDDRYDDLRLPGEDIRVTLTANNFGAWEMTLRARKASSIAILPGRRC